MKKGWHIDLCNICMQITNHENGECLKCKSAKSINNVGTNKNWFDVALEEALKTGEIKITTHK